VSQGIKLERNQFNISGVMDNVSSTTVVVNISHSYKSKCNEPCEEDIAMVDVAVEGVSSKTLNDSYSNLTIIIKQFLDKLPSNMNLLILVVAEFGWRLRIVIIRKVISFKCR